MKMVFGYNFGKLSVAVVHSESQTLAKGDWKELDPASLSPELRQAYEDLKSARRLAQEARTSFETMMREKAGFKVEAKAKPIAKAAMSLAEFLAQA